MTDIQKIKAKHAKITELEKEIYQLQTDIAKLKFMKSNKAVIRRGPYTLIATIERILKKYPQGLHLQDIIKKLNKGTKVPILENNVAGVLNRYCRKYQVVKKIAPHTYTLIN